MDTSSISTFGWTLRQWLAVPPQQRLSLLRTLQTQLCSDDPAWICCATEQQLEAQISAIDGRGDQLPLFAIPFAVKDNIDAAQWPTTAGCPDYTYTPDKDATVVAALRQAGAVLIGKTNLDQFATGLVGTRSPYGAVPNPFNPAYISGGSSSGSASVVARGIVPFALGTDTAGSGRVPAGCTNIVGLKPSRGHLSTSGVVPACQSLDCVSIFALTLDDAELVLSHCAGFDESDPYSREPHPPAELPKQLRKLGIPHQCQWFGDTLAQAAWEHTLTCWQSLGVELVAIDFSPMKTLAQLLYQGPWVAERHAAIREFFNDSVTSIHPVVRTIIEQATQFSATDAFIAEYQRQGLVRQITALMQSVDALMVPTAPLLPTIAAVDADPIGVNSQLGLWTNFVNLSDLCALALPAGFRRDGLPHGVTLIAPAWYDRHLIDWSRKWISQQALPLGATQKPSETPQSLVAQLNCDGRHQIAVVGAHLSGMPLNHQLTERQGRLIATTRTSPDYRLYALANCHPAKPGLLRVSADGCAIEVEIWELTSTAFATFVSAIPSPLGIGTITLSDGSLVQGFLCESIAVATAEDISAYGGWRAWIGRSSLSATSP